MAINSVVELNAGWFETLDRDAPDVFSEQLRSLKRLGNRPRVMDFLKAYPETAGLLATADNPEDLVEILDTTDVNHTLIMGLFVRCVGRRDIDALAGALKKNRDLVCNLAQRGLVGSEVLFVFPRTGPGVIEYQNWLQDNLNNRLAGSDEDLASFVQFALLQGRDLLDKLNKDELFRKKFRTQLWPKLLRVINRKDEALEFYMDVADIWPLLSLDRGEELLERRGLLPAALLFGPDAYPKDFQERTIEILLAGDGITFEALTSGRFRKEILFRKLLRRPLPSPVLAAALNKLFEQKDNYRPLLEKYNRLTDTVLAEEVGPPPDGPQTWLPFYTHYMIARKLYQGREPTTEEWVDVGIDTAIDAASLAIPLLKGSKIATQTIKKVGTKSAKKVVTREVMENALKTARKKISNEAVEQLTKAGMEKQARKWVTTNMFTVMQQSYRNTAKVIEKSSAFEITDAVQFFYKQSNMGRESYRRLTQLEARVFMRGDAKVYIHADRIAHDQVKQYLNGWFADKVTEGITEAAENQNWRRHISAWWLLNTGDQIPSP